MYLYYMLNCKNQLIKIESAHNVKLYFLNKTEFFNQQHYIKWGLIFLCI